MNHAKEQVQFIAQSLKVETRRMDTGRTADFKDALMALANLEQEYHVQVTWRSRSTLMSNDAWLLSGLIDALVSVRH